MAHLVYCDYIATVIKNALNGRLSEGYVARVGPTQLDLDPREGYLLSHKKEMIVTDSSGQKYRVTVEDIE